MSDFDPVVLIHGAWQGAWAWARFMPYLEAAGLAAHAVDLPGNGVDGTDPADVTFEACLQHVHGIVHALDRPVSLVGHSGGGLLITAFAERWPECVARLVYVVGRCCPMEPVFSKSRWKSGSSIRRLPAYGRTCNGRMIVTSRAYRQRRRSRFS
jgi:pimeloyl-ACP methyl ester carboxylesterase